MPGIVAKCMNARPKIREKAIEVILMYIEAEKQEIVSQLRKQITKNSTSLFRSS